MTNDHLVQLPFSKLDGWGRDCHAILHGLSKLPGEVRIEVSYDNDGCYPVHFRVFDEACECAVPVPELIESIGEAANRMELVARGDSPETVDFYFSDVDAAVVFKLANGGAA